MAIVSYFFFEFVFYLTVFFTELLNFCRYFNLLTSLKIGLKLSYTLDKTIDAISFLEVLFFDFGIYLLREIHLRSRAV